MKTINVFSVYEFPKIKRTATKTDMRFVRHGIKFLPAVSKVINIFMILIKSSGKELKYILLGYYICSIWDTFYMNCKSCIPYQGMKAKSC